jgi:hypothetical protein
LSSGEITTLRLLNGPASDTVQALVSYTSLWAPNAVDAVTAKYPHRISALGRGRSKTELAFVVLRNTIGEGLFRGSFDLARIFEQQSVSTVLVVRCTAIASFKTDDASMVREQWVDPPPTMRSLVQFPMFVRDAKYMVLEDDEVVERAYENG